MLKGWRMINKVLMLKRPQDAVDLEPVHNIYVAESTACDSTLTKKFQVFGNVYSPIEGELKLKVAGHINLNFEKQAGSIM
jgi:hypothetical protein